MPSPLKIIAAGILLMASSCSSEKHDEQACSPPRESWQRPVNTSAGDFGQVDVAVDRGSRIYLYGTQVSLSELANRLGDLPRNVTPTLRVFLETEMGASCKVVEDVRDTFERALNCREPFRCNEGIQTLWHQMPQPPGTPPA
jgi:hypothetical protein